MHFRGLDLNLLVALDALLTERNVTRASERIGISQPGMSAALQKLRDHFDDPLLERVGRRLELTPRAKEMTGIVKEVLSTIDTLSKATPSFDPIDSSRSFAIAMSTYCADIIGDKIAAYLLDNAPSITCRIDDLSSESLSQLDNGRYDFCITVAQRAILDPAYVGGSLLEKHLFTDQFCVVAAADNDKFRKVKNFREFCSLPYVEVVFGGNVMSIMDYAFRGQVRRPMTRMSLPGFGNALSLVSRSKYVTIAPRRLCEVYKKSLSLQTKSFELPIPHLRETLIWHMRVNDDGGNIWFRDALLAMCKEL
jgi:DNA-binding transcriptional LysR family regulator